ncbi:MAG: PDZ domain-containing protein [Bacteroidales bacterium]|nr:PDZ domain-containing protein [Bacteroidales bacterium]
MKRLLVSMLLMSAAISVLNAEEGRLLRFPTTNGQDVVFSYAGDLYKAPLSGGQAVRLTSHVGYEMFARYSPDGNTIAFTAQYDGNTEVYSIPARGGEPQRLTYTSTNSRDDLGDRMGPNNIVMGWSPDGRNIIYRNRIGDGFIGKLWTISSKGGMSEELPLPEGGFCCYSPDGKKLAYNRTMREFRTWKYYRGGQADDIWIYDGKSVKNITENEAQDIMPMWIGDEIYFISDRDHWMNIFVYNTKSGATTKVTDFKEYDVKFPSTNGRLIVFENAGYLYSLDPVSKQYKRIDIELNAEGIYARGEKMDVSRNLSSVSISEKGDRFVVTARGEVFSAPVGKGVVKNLSRTPGANERGAMLSPDGQYIAYISDRSGETEIYLQDADAIEAKQLTRDSDTYIRSLAWAPDSKSLIYTDRKNRLVQLSIPDGGRKLVLTSASGEFSRPVFSPDSKWISYTRTETNEMSVIYVCNLETKKEFAVTEKWYSSNGPIFSSDGKYLIFSSSRELNPIYSNIEWNYAYTNMNAMYMAILAADTPSPLLPKDGKSASSIANDSKSAPSGKDGKAASGSKEEGVSVRIDPEGIFDRIVKIPAAGASRAIYCDGKSIFFGGRGGTSSFDFESGEVKNVSDGNLSAIVGKKALFSKGGQYFITDAPRGRVGLDGGTAISGLIADIDYPQEWAQIFDEAWRAFRDGFYLENMHGIDWKAMRAKYEVLLPYVKCRLDLNYVIGEMIGELTVGHAYVSPGNYAKAERIDMGLLGARISRDKSGYYRIDHIFKGAQYSESLRSPLNMPGLDVKEGDYIVAINGIPTTTADNIYSMLVGKAGVLTELSINSKASENGAHKIVVEPIADEYGLYHYEWVMNNIEYVNKKSGGKIGYIYIPDMSADGLNEFARYYYPQLDKEALIIDDRANGGGNISPMVIERLLREPYRLTMRRGSDLIGTIPEGTFVGPKVCLIDKYSASDGDLFPWSFRATGLGELIGTRTWGGIVGISGSLPFMDGTDIRVPFFTNYDAKSGEWIIENHGVDPDIWVDNDPIKQQAGIDQQLDKAIEVLLEKLKTRKPLPGVPAPRDFSYE